MRIITNYLSHDPAATGPGPLPLPTPEVDGSIGDNSESPNDGCICPTGGSGTTGTTGSTGGANDIPLSCPYPPLSMVYSPAQSWGDLYEPQQALQQGTLFRCLDKPFLGKGVSGR